MSNATAARKIFNTAADRFGVQAKQRITAALEHLGQTVLDDIKADTPVQTGNLRHGWDYQVTGLGLTWYNNVAYASDVEYGHAGAMLRLNTLPEPLRQRLTAALKE